ncbi:hypothetical protein ACQPYK_49645 (plasmid) [Streptosporangium sp. CA-135522]|uniref:hypothetical protein n=1 Tax=Streptosporangium sp. CA-135522 TaxID=3240072 RepID=UPI003D942D68
MTCRITARRDLRGAELAMQQAGDMIGALLRQAGITAEAYVRDIYAHPPKRRDHPAASTPVHMGGRR